MKKIFHLQQKNKNQDRLLEAIKHEIRKYLKRERRKVLPEKAVYWDFDCRFGKNSDEAKSLFAPEIIKALDIAKDEGWEQCYVEVTSRASFEARVKVSEDDLAKQNIQE